MKTTYDLIKIFPDIDFEASCPYDGSDLRIKRVIIPGMHCLADAVCPVCDTPFYIDLPVGQALFSPIILDRNTTDIHDPQNVDWFSLPLRNGFLHPEREELVPRVQKFFEADRILLLNCIDSLYGHSLLKLLNVQQYLDHNPELGCCVLVPTQLVHLVPEGVAEIWECPISMKDGLKWYPSLEQWIGRQINSRHECFLSPAFSHPNNRMYDLRRFIKDLPDISDRLHNHSPIILFSYREDRLWGRSFGQQRHNLQGLYKQLHTIFPELAFVLVGFGHQPIFHTPDAHIIDLRTERFTVEQDRLWLAYMHASDCAVGVHGSNMLLPSGLAKSTVELVPTSRLGNTVQDFLFPSDLADHRDALLFYRMLYGNPTLSDIASQKVCALIVSTLADSPLNALWFNADAPETFKKLHNFLESAIVKDVELFFRRQMKPKPRVIQKILVYIKNFLGKIC